MKSEPQYIMALAFNVLSAITVKAESILWTICLKKVCGVISEPRLIASLAVGELFFPFIFH